MESGCGGVLVGNPVGASRGIDYRNVVRGVSSDALQELPKGVACVRIRLRDGVGGQSYALAMAGCRLPRNTRPAPGRR